MAEAKIDTQAAGGFWISFFWASRHFFSHENALGCNIIRIDEPWLHDSNEKPVRVRQCIFCSNHQQTVNDMKTIIDAILSLEELFEYAEKDLHSYANIVGDFEKMRNGGAMRVESLVLLAAFRYRSRRALSLMSEQVPETYQESRRKLRETWKEAEQRLECSLRGEKFEKFFQRLVREKFGDPVQELKALAADIEETYWNIEYEEPGPDLMKKYMGSCEMFISLFQKIFYLNEELQKSPFPAAGTAGYFQEHYGKANEIFEQSYLFFGPGQEILLSMRKREYGVECWWFENTKQLATGDERYYSEKGVEDCEWAERTLGLAMGDLPPEERQRAFEHVMGCPSCFVLYHDTVEVSRGGWPAGPQDTETPRELQDAVFREKGVSREGEDFKPKGFSELVRLFLNLKVLLPLAAAIGAVMFLTFSMQKKAGPVNCQMAILKGAGNAASAKGGATEDDPVLKPGETLATESKFRIRLKLDKNAFVYLVFPGASGKSEIVYSDRLPRGETVIPRKDADSFAADWPEGFLVVSAKDLPDLKQTMALFQPDLFRPDRLDELRRALPDATVEDLGFIFESQKHR